MVEAIANGIEDKLIDGLSFKMNPGASYVVDRRSVTFHPQGSNIYKKRRVRSSSGFCAGESRDNDAAQAFGFIHNKHVTYKNTTFPGITPG